MSRVVVSRDGFSLNEEKIRILSGAFHYFRVHPEQWRERLELLRGMGLNAVETYVPWNMHEPRPGEYSFTGLTDLSRFLSLSAEVGLHAIVRPGPYICAEWDNGGFPSWLLADRNMRLRCMDARYLEAVDRWFDALIPVIAPHQSTKGGNVLIVQVENEYGSYGNDQEYLRYLADGLRSRDIDVPLFTSDGPTGFMFSGGTLPGAFATANFGSRATEAFELQRAVRPDDDDPLFCMEYWNGWFDHFGEHHHTRSTEDAANALDEILGQGASVNLYMAHGGTNFGFWAGANHHDKLAPTVTSYDYDAPIDERGAPTAKYWAYREIFAKYAEVPPAPEWKSKPTLPAGTVELANEVRLLAALSGEIGSASGTTVRSAYPLTFEELGLAHGMVLYRTRIAGWREAMKLSIDGLADHALVIVDGKELAHLDRDGETSVELPEIPPEGVEVEILVHAMGGVNYGPLLGERKGITGGVRHGQQFLFGWDITSIPLAGEPTLARAARLNQGRPDSKDSSQGNPGSNAPSPPGNASGPVFRSGTLQVDGPADAFIALPGWAKGVVWINGFCVGRFWEIGPQRTLYVPAPLLQAGANEIVVLELLPDKGSSSTIEIRTEPDLGPTT